MTATHSCLRALTLGSMEQDRPGEQPAEVVDDRVEQHTHEQRQRAADEPQHEDTPDRTVSTEASPHAEEELRAAEEARPES